MSDRIDINTTYIEKITSLIEKKELSKIKLISKELHSAELAEIMQKLSIKHAHTLFHIIEDNKSASILIELEDNTRKSILSNLTPKQIAEEIIENLESDDAADIIGEFSEKNKKEILSHIENIEQAIDINDLLTYPKDTAGGIMAKELIKVNEKWDTLRCLKEMRKQAEEVKKYTQYM